MTGQLERFGVLRHVMLTNRYVRWMIRNADREHAAGACAADCRECERFIAERSLVTWKGRVK